MNPTGGPEAVWGLSSNDGVLYTRVHSGPWSKQVGEVSKLTGRLSQWHRTAASAQDSDLTADIINWDITEQTHHYSHLILHLPFVREDPPFFQRINHNLHYFAQGKKLTENYMIEADEQEQRHDRHLTHLI